MNSNAIAGPSNEIQSPSSNPSIVPSIAPSISDLLLQIGNNNPSPLSGSQDLLTLFNLKPLYDTYVRPVPPPNSNTDGTTEGGLKSVKTGTLSIGFTMGGIRIGGGSISAGAGESVGLGIGEKVAGIEGASATGKGKRLKLEKSYAHLVEDIPGRNTIRKDSHLSRLILNPDVQPFTIQPFNATTLRDGFSLQVGQIPGFDSLIWESEEACVGKKKKKKRKHDSDSNNNNNNNNSNSTNGGVLGGEEDNNRKKKKRKGSETSTLHEEA